MVCHKVECALFRRLDVEGRRSLHHTAQGLESRHACDQETRYAAAWAIGSPWGHTVLSVKSNAPRSREDSRQAGRSRLSSVSLDSTAT